MTLLAVADQPPAAAAGAAVFEALGRSENVTDRWIPDAVTCAAAANGEHFLRAVAGAKQPGERLLGVVAVVAEHYARGGPVGSAGAVIARLAEADPAVADGGGPRAGQGVAGQDGPEARRRHRGGPRQADRPARPGAAGAGRPARRRLGEQAGRELRGRDRQDARRQGGRPVGQVEDRVAAASELVGYQAADKELVQRLLEVVTPQAPPELGVGILRAVQASEAAGAGGLIADRLPGMTPTVRSAGIGVLLSRAEWTRALRRPSTPARSSSPTCPSNSGRPWPTTRTPASAGPPWPPSRGGAAERRPAEGDRGVDAESSRRRATRRPARWCSPPSAPSATPTPARARAIGPDLTGMAVHPKEELLVHVLDPSRSVEGNFRVYTAKLLDGRVLQGMLASESRTAVEVIDAEGKKHSVLREDIESLAGSARSLMPEGFEKQVPQGPDRPAGVPDPEGEVPAAAAGQGGDRRQHEGHVLRRAAGTAERLVFPDWKPKAFNGVPFVLVDPQGDRVKNAVMLNGPNGVLPPRMPKAVSCRSTAGEGRPPAERRRRVGRRAPRPDGPVVDDRPAPLRRREDGGPPAAGRGPLRGLHPPGGRAGSEIRVRSCADQQVRYLAVTPKRPDAVVKSIELVKGPDGCRRWSWRSPSKPPSSLWMAVVPPAPPAVPPDRESAGGDPTAGLE